MSDARRPPARTARLVAGLTALGAACLLTIVSAAQQDTPPSQERPAVTFRGGVDLVNIAVTVHDGTGRFVPNLKEEDFVVYEDNHPQPLTFFSAETIPVSLGLVVDTSNSMAGEQMDAARSALRQFFITVLDQETDQDEIFLTRFSDRVVQLQNWTNDRGRLTLALGRMSPDGGTALYDAVEDGIEKAGTGRHPKKALVVISDGNDTSSRATLAEVRRITERSEALVYAIGLDGNATVTIPRQQPPRAPFPVPTPPPMPVPNPFPRPGLTPRPPAPGIYPQFGGQSPGGYSGSSRRNDERVNAGALRQLTDQSGGRTEIVREPRDLSRATSAIANELSRQYSMAYAATVARDGAWHTIRVELKRPGYTVRARRGYFAN